METNGRVVVDDGELKVTKGSGRYVKNPPYSPYVYERVLANEAARLMKEVSVQRSEEDMKIGDVEEPPMDDEPAMTKPSKTLPEEPVAKPAPVALGPIQSPTKPAIDAKPTVRVRAPPGGKSSIFF